MSRFNNHKVDAIYAAAETWKERCLIADGSVFTDEKLWRTDLLDELDELYIEEENVDEGKNYWVKLQEQIKDKGSLECKQLMAEIHWASFLFPLGIRVNNDKSDMRAELKREKIRDIWSWSGKTLEDDHSLLSKDTLAGIGKAGTNYNINRWYEIKLLMTVVRDLKTHPSNKRESILNDSWQFAERLRRLSKTANWQLNHILPHLLFPDIFERISAKEDKRKILAYYTDIQSEDLDDWDFTKIDRELLELRKRLEEEKGREIDFYEEEFEKDWKSKPQKQKKRKREKNDIKHTTQVSPTSTATVQPKNLILYGPPGTGKTYRLRTKHMPQYKDRCVFVTFHQSYAYEDFVEGIRPQVDEKGALTYNVRDGVFKKLCERASKEPSKEFALFIDEINRGNIARIFGELISLIEVDKRIGNSKELKVTLPYSERKFGVPANVHIIGTMNTADRSIALLDSALRRRFQFEELMPDPTLLKKPINDGEEGEIDLRKLLEVMNARLTHLLHRDQTIGHSYFMDVKDFKHLREIFAHKILPLLQEAFYDNWRHICLVLANKTTDEKDQLVRSHKQNSAQLFPSEELGDVGEGTTFDFVQENKITPNAIRKIYEPPEPSA